MKAKARRVAWFSWGVQHDSRCFGEEYAAYRLKLAERWADYLKGCSCAMCGNPRRVFKDAITRQERKFRLSAEEQEEMVSEIKGGNMGV
jgi:hypothetical protein